MGGDREPKFLMVMNREWNEGIDGPDLVLFNSEGNPIPRSGETFMDRLDVRVEALRFPEYFEIISAEKYSWKMVITSERLIFYKPMDKFPGLFEFMDHVDINGILLTLEPTGTLTVDDMFTLVEKKRKELKDFTMAFQIAYTRISSISVNKEEGHGGKAVMNNIEIWYKDSVNDTDTQFLIYPKHPNVDNPYDIALRIHKLALEEKLRCTEKRYELDPVNFNKGDYNTWKSAIKRLIQRPEMTIPGSGTPDPDSWDPITFQTHPVQWLTDQFARSLDPDAPVHISM